jgi:hypothetical protein
MFYYAINISHLVLLWYWNVDYDGLDMWDTRKANRILVEKSLGKCPLGR